MNSGVILLGHRGLYVMLKDCYGCVRGFVLFAASFPHQFQVPGFVPRNSGDALELPTEVPEQFPDGHEGSSPLGLPKVRDLHLWVGVSAS